MTSTGVSPQMDDDLKVVFTNGCFDLFHAGHLKILTEAKKMGDVLYVGINSDVSIYCYLNKGHKRPIISEDQRVEIVSSIKCVDKVFLFDEPTPIRLIEKIKPDIIVKGGDYSPRNVVGAHLADIVIVPFLPEVSTSAIIQRIKNG